MYPEQIQNRLVYSIEEIKAYKLVFQDQERGTMRCRILQLFLCIILLTFAERWVSFVFLGLLHVIRVGFLL